MRKTILTVLICLAPQIVLAQSWSGIIDSTRATDWTQAGVQGGIPTGRPNCTTGQAGVTVPIAAYTGTGATINNAIAACAAANPGPTGSVLLLAAGTFTISDQVTFIGHSYVTLRGAGPDQTILKFTNSVGCDVSSGNVCFSNSNQWNPQPPSGTVVNWTAGYAAGTTVITLASVTGLHVGDVLVIDQCDTGLSTSGCTGTPADNGQLFVCTGVLSTCTVEAGSFLTRVGRSQVEVKHVTNISGNNVTISPPLIMPNWASAQSTQGWYSGDSIHDDGLEGVTVDLTSASGAGGFTFTGAYNSWLKNVRGIKSGRNMIWAEVAANISVVDSYFYGVQTAASTSYGFETDMASSILVQNVIWQHMTSPMVMGEGAIGHVYGYNFAVNVWYQPFAPSTSDWQQASSYQHNAANDYPLIEGNNGIMLEADDIHGTSHFVTGFRNYWNGRDPQGGSSAGKFAQTNGVIIQAFNRYYNLVGNVLGTSGYHQNYNCLSASTTDVCSGSNCPTSGYSIGNCTIFDVGYSGNAGSHDSGLVNDPFAVTSLMRWGNYDTVNNATRFVSGEVPSGISPYANALPASHTLPASFYLAARPSAWWGTPWGTPAWPPNGPDVTAGNISGVGGFANKIPAQLCYENAAIDSNYTGDGTDRGVLLFNANTCYQAASSPSGTGTSVSGGVKLSGGAKVQ